MVVVFHYNYILLCMHLAIINFETMELSVMLHILKTHFMFTQNGSTALHKAAQHSHREVIKYLVGEGAKVNLENKVTITSLM